MQFTIHVGDDLAKPVFKKRAAFVFKYQAITSESESKVTIFSPFPRFAEINLTQAIYMLESVTGPPIQLGSCTSIKTASICFSRKHMPYCFSNLKQELAFWIMG